MQPSSAVAQPVPLLGQLNKSDKAPDHGTGYMNSFMKFLRGETERSPPPPSRAGRKPNGSPNAAVDVPKERKRGRPPKEKSEGREPLQRRELSKRAAKEKSYIQQMMAKQSGDDDVEDLLDYADSDSDPAWTPYTKDYMEEEVPQKRGRRSGQKRVEEEQEEEEEEEEEREEEVEEEEDREDDAEREVYEEEVDEEEDEVEEEEEDQQKESNASPVEES